MRPDECSPRARCGAHRDRAAGERGGGVKPARNVGRIVADTRDDTGRSEKLFGKRLGVQPLQRRALVKQPVIEVESVNIDDCAHIGPGTG